MSNISIASPNFSIRGIPLYGFATITTFVDMLLPSDQVFSGLLIAINAEKILAAEASPPLRALLLSGSINYPDGISIVRSIRKKYRDSQVTRIAGADLWPALMARAGKLRRPVFLIGSQPEVLQQTVDKLQQQWQVPIVGQQDGYFLDEQMKAVIEQVIASQAQIVTVAMGSPRQEMFIQRCYAAYPDALYMGVGGTYDVFTGRVKRAPVGWQRLGLEWLYRLIKQPSRLGRQWKLLKYLAYHWRGQL